MPDKENGLRLRRNPALRVIQRQGEFRSNGLVKNLCKWFRKNIPAENPHSEGELHCDDRIKILIVPVIN